MEDLQLFCGTMSAHDQCKANGGFQQGDCVLPRRLVKISVRELHTRP